MRLVFFFMVHFLLGGGVSFSPFLFVAYEYP